MPDRCSTPLGRVSALIASVAMAGCASILPGGSPTPAKVSPDTSGTFDTAGAYQISEAEKALDCRKLTGRMQVRLLQIRDPQSRPSPSELSTGAQAALAPVFGGPTTSADNRDQLARDRAILDAYNKQLAAKGCATFDIYAELQKSDVMHTPRPVAKAPTKATR